MKLPPREKIPLEHLDLGKDKTQELMAETLGYTNVEEMLTKFKEVLNKLEEGADRLNCQKQIWL